VLKFVVHCFTFCVKCRLGGYHPLECTRVENLGVNSRNVSFQTLTISSRMACSSAFNSTGCLLQALIFKLPHRKKNRVLLGPANEVAIARHRNEESPAAETNGEGQPC
jgi:hypothetical protein